MPNDVFLNGVPHSVQTSELTKNAINPRNTFIDSEKNELDDTSTDFAKHVFDPMKALQSQPDSTENKQPQSTYPTTKDSFNAHDFLSVSKTHLTDNNQKFSSDQSSESEMFYESLHRVEDRIQNLRKKHPSKNIQQLDQHTMEVNQQATDGLHRFNDNMQSLHQQSFSDNRQLIDEKTVGDNFQKLAPTESRRDNILYKEKKNIHENYQQIETPNPDRASATLAQSMPSEKMSDLNEQSLHVDNQIPTKANSKILLSEDELRARVRKMKENIGKVNQSLTDIEEDK